MRAHIDRPEAFRLLADQYPTSFQEWLWGRRPTSEDARRLQPGDVLNRVEQLQIGEGAPQGLTARDDETATEGEYQDAVEEFPPVPGHVGDVRTDEEEARVGGGGPGWLSSRLGRPSRLRQRGAIANQMMSRLVGDPEREFNLIGLVARTSPMTVGDWFRDLYAGVVTPIAAQEVDFREEDKEGRVPGYEGYDFLTDVNVRGGSRHRVSTRILARLVLYMTNRPRDQHVFAALRARYAQAGKELGLTPEYLALVAADTVAVAMLVPDVEERAARIVAAHAERIVSRSAELADGTLRHASGWQWKRIAWSLLLLCLATGPLYTFTGYGWEWAIGALVVLGCVRISWSLSGLILSVFRRTYAGAGEVTLSRT